MTDFGPAGASRAHEPIFSIPAVVVVLVGLLLAIHGGLTYLGEPTMHAVQRDWGFVPARLTIALWPDQLDSLRSHSNHDANALSQAWYFRYFYAAHGAAAFWTLGTYALLHGSWAHVGVNCIWLVAFGPPIARRFGALRFLLFFGTTAVAGALAHWALTPMDFSPLIGASAADSGLMAATARFVFQPGAPLGARRGYGAASSGSWGDVPAASLAQLLTDRRALIFIAIWMATNFVFGAGAQTLGASEAPVAWVAHVGGFLAGLLLFPLFDSRARRV
jgi:membrane associated rhomboid family serine protease